jgi:hypothetical protein
MRQPPRGQRLHKSGCNRGSAEPLSHLPRRRSADDSGYEGGRWLSRNRSTSPRITTAIENPWSAHQVLSCSSWSWGNRTGSTAGGPLAETRAPGLEKPSAADSGGIVGRTGWEAGAVDSPLRISAESTCRRSLAVRLSSALRMRSATVLLCGSGVTGAISEQISILISSDVG